MAGKFRAKRKDYVLPNPLGAGISYPLDPGRVLTPSIACSLEVGICDRRRPSHTHLP